MLATEKIIAIFILVFIVIFNHSSGLKVKEIKAGEDFKLQCRIEVTDQPDMLQLKPRWRLPSHVTNTTRLKLSAPQKVEENGVLTWKNDITIKASEIDDSGLYQCELYAGEIDYKLLLPPTDSGSWVSSNYTIPEDRKRKSVFAMVYDGKSLLVNTPSSIIVEGGTNLILPCRRTLKNAVDVKLARIARPTPASRIGFDPAIGYIIYNTTDDDTGLWKCTTSYNDVETSRKMMVHVYASTAANIGSPKIYPVPGNTVLTNNTFILHCEVPCEIGTVVKFQWIYPREYNRSVILPTYGKVKNGERTQVNPNIPNLPLLAKSGYEFWWSNIEIPQAKLGDSGIYSCRVNSGKILKMATVNIQVLESPYLNIISQPRFTNGTMEGVQGYPTELRFVVDSFPEADFQWMKNAFPVNESGTIIKEDKDGKRKYTALIFNSTDTTDIGTYELDIRNSLKSIKIQFQLKVVEPFPPSFVDPTPKSHFLEIGQDTKLYCSVEGRPEPRMIWYHNDDPLSENATVHSLVRAQLGDAGNYTCVATNDIGQAFKNIMIHVKDPSRDYTIGFATGSSILLALLVYMGTLLFIKIRKVKKIKQRMELTQRYLVPILDPNEMPVEEQAERLSYDPKKWEIPRDRLKFGKTLGRGAFGKVVQATAFDINKSSSCKTVAVKMLKAGSRSCEYRALMSELKILIHLGPHLNIVNLLGACTTKDGPLMIVVEYCRQGNLSNYLRSMRDRYVGLRQKKRGDSKGDETETDGDIHDPKRSSGDEGDITDAASVSDESAFVDCTDERRNNSKWLKDGKRDSTTSCISASDTIASGEDVDMLIRSKSRLSSSESEGGRSIKKGRSSDDEKKSDERTTLNAADLLSYSLQVARGMEFLSSKQCIHRDLAARNILVSDYQVVKICDFGLARDVYKDPDYIRIGEARLPLKWMALESIFDKVYSTKSDVWSFGVLLWEIFSLGASPYPGIQMDEDFCNKLKRGVRMKKPQYGTDEIYSDMLACWAHKPEDRPTFTRLTEEISDILQSEAGHEYLDVLKIFETNVEAKVLRGVRPVQDPDETFEDVKVSEKEDKRHALITAVDYTDLDMKAIVCEKKREAEEDACASTSFVSEEGQCKNSMVSIEIGEENDACHDRTGLLSENLNDSGLCVSTDRNLLYADTASCPSLHESSATSICESPPSYTTVVDEIQ